MVRNLFTKLITIFQILHILHYILVITSIGGIIVISYLAYKYYILKKHGNPQVTTNRDGTLDISEDRRQRSSYVEIENPIEEVSL